MTQPRAAESRSLRAIDALLRLRDLKGRKTKAKLQLKKAEISRARAEIELLRRKRDLVLRQASGRVLQQRLYSDALTRIVLERRRELERLEAEAAVLIESYLEAKGRRDAVSRLRDRRVLDKETLMERRSEERAQDAAAARSAGASAAREEDPCEE
jgi:hypothetical protein